MVITEMGPYSVTLGFESTAPCLSYSLNLSGDGSVIQVNRRTSKSEEVFSLLPADFASGEAGEFAEIDHLQSATYEVVVLVMKSNSEIIIRDFEDSHIEFEFCGPKYNNPKIVRLSHFIKAGAY